MIQPRPQPIGIFPFPASHLLLPPTVGDSCHQVFEALLCGDLKASFPKSWEFFRLAAQGEIKQALQSLVETGSDDLAGYNRFVLDPSRTSYVRLSQALRGPEKEMLDLAAFAFGLQDHVADSFSLDGELLAFALATAASADIEAGNMDAAITKLQKGIEASRPVSPLLAATLLSQEAELQLQVSENPVAMVIQKFQEAIRLAGNSQLPMLLAELHVKLGMVLQNAANGQRGALLQAVNAYQFALQNGVTREADPMLFAQLQNNLGLAYLSMPNTGSSHQLRSAIAIQSFRHALDVYTIEGDPDLWASVSMNLANALQHVPTSHPEENLIQAVETYEKILQVRSRAKDPVAYALVLLNQSNALAHLGIFKPALEKLAEAYKLFHWYNQPDKADAAREIVEHINARMGGEQSPLKAGEVCSQEE